MGGTPKFDRIDFIIVKMLFFNEEKRFLEFHGFISSRKMFLAAFLSEKSLIFYLVQYIFKLESAVSIDIQFIHLLF